MIGINASPLEYLRMHERAFADDLRAIRESVLLHSFFGTRSIWRWDGWRWRFRGAEAK